MPQIDYYKVLGLTKTATEKDIKSAYRKLARKFHPDLNPSDKEANSKFQEVNEANEVLSDPAKRKKYDEHGDNWQHADQYQQAQQRSGQSAGYAGGGAGGGYDNEGFNDGGDFSEYFNSMFGNMGGGGRKQTKYRGQDFRAELHLNLRDVLKAEKRTLTVNGKNIRLTIPAGVENGQTIKITGHGGPGSNGGPAGDLLLTFVINNDEHFRRDGNNLHITAPIDVYKAILGGDIEVETLTGKVKVAVKPETQNGTKVKLKGKGMPVYKKDGDFGDLYITYQVQVPTNLSDEQKALFKQLADLHLTT